MKQPFEVFLELDKSSEVCRLRHFPPDNGAHLVGLGDDAIPWILFHLLDPEGDPFALLVDLQHHSVNLITLLDHLRWVNNLASPRHVADVQQAIDPIFEFDERAVVGQVAYRPCDQVIDRILLGNHLPWVDLDLLHPEGYLLAVLFDLEDDNLNLIPGIDNLLGVVDATGP